MKVLVTGISGFIGKNLLELASSDLEIIGIYNTSTDIRDFVNNRGLENVQLIKCDLTNIEEVQNLREKVGAEVDYCLYLAGNVNVPLSKENPVDDLNKTVVGLINFIKCFNKIKRFIFLSTAGVYDSNVGEVDINTLLNPKEPYCISKLMAEQYIKHFQSIGKIKEYVIIRFSGAYGKYSPKKFMTKLVKDIYVDEIREVEVYGNGTNLINVLYVNDAITALLAGLKSDISNIVCNLGQENMTISEVVSRVSKIFGNDVKIKLTPTLKEQKYITFNYKSDFNDFFSFKPDFSFEEGILEFGKVLKNES